MNDEPRVASLDVPSRIESVRPAAAFCVDTARRQGVAAADHPLFEVAVVEALNNALMHNQREAEGVIHCEVEVAGRSLKIRVFDESARSPVTFPSGAASWPDPSLDSWETIPERGYGLYLIQAVFSDVRPVSRNGHHGVEMELSF